MSHTNSAFFIAEELFDIAHSTNTSCYRCEFDQAQYKDSLFVHHKIENHPSLDRAVIKRKAEFLAGRYAAQQAMKKLGIEKTTVGIGQHRNPIWPKGLVGSITHNATHAICAVARNTDYQSIGIDLADPISLDTANNIKDRIIQTNEVDTLVNLPLSFEQSLTLAFSAKESLFKALYPQVETYFGFHAAEIHAVEMNSQTFLIRLTRDLTSSLAKDTVFKGSFKMQPDSVFTSIFITHDLI